MRGGSRRGLLFKVLMNTNVLIGSVEELFERDFEVKPNFGYVYAIELEHGIKIGRTHGIKRRLSNLRNVFERYGDRKMLRVAVSPLHSNYIQNETSLFSTLRTARRGNTEMFSASFDVVVLAMQNLFYSSEYDSDKANEKREMIKNELNDLWGVSERTSKTIFDGGDGRNDIQLKVGNYGYWWVCINGQSFSMDRDYVLNFVVWYATHHETWEIIEYLDYLDNPDDCYLYADEPVSKWMLDAISPYCQEDIIRGIWLLIREKLIEFETKHDLYVSAMYRIAKERGYECCVAPVATYEQIINENYDGLEPIVPTSLNDKSVL